MSFRASFIFLFLFLYSFRATAEIPNFVHHYCRNTTRYTANSIYFTNLKTLWSSLSSTNASYSTGFQNATAGQARDMVTGLFLCRGDVSLEVCRDCVSYSVKDIVRKCPNQREATIYYDQCMLRYSDRNIFLNVTLDDGFIMYNDHYDIPSAEQTRFENLVLTTMIEVAFEAANSSRRFCTRKTKWNEYQDLYVLVQCTPDLTRQDCVRCLDQSIYESRFGSVGERLLLPSCYSRYELYKFYNKTDVNTTPLPPPPLEASTHPVSSAPRPRVTHPVSSAPRPS